MEIIQNKMERKMSLITSEANDLDKVQDLNPATKSLLTKYRRESVNLPFKESFFDSSKTTTPPVATPPIVVNNIIPRKQSIDKSDSNDKLNATRRKSSTSSYVNYHFLNKLTKSKISSNKSDQSDSVDTEDDNNIVLPRQQESIIKDIEKKKDLINQDLDDSELAKRQQSLSPATVNLLNKYRRESVNLPYAESFFNPPILGGNKQQQQSESIDEETKSKIFLSR
jgi:hypothetical protein